MINSLRWSTHCARTNKLCFEVAFKMRRNKPKTQTNKQAIKTNILTNTQFVHGHVSNVMSSYFKFCPVVSKEARRRKEGLKGKELGEAKISQWEPTEANMGGM